MLIFWILFGLKSIGLTQELAPNETGLLMTKSFEAGLNFNTAGWGVSAEYTKQKNVKYKFNYGLQISSIHHPKEYKILGTSGTKSYYFGKLNSLVGVRFTYGGNLLLFESKRNNGVEIYWKWKVGPNLGLLKPVYLKIDYASGGGIVQEVEKYEPETHNAGDIYSRASWWKGLGEAKLAPAVFVKSGFEFNFAIQKDKIAGGELGVMIDYFPLGEVELLYNSENNSFFPAIYLQFNLGQKF